MRYLSLADGSLLTVQGGFCYYLGEKDPMRLLSAFIAGAEERVELLPPNLTVDETPFGLEPEHPVTVPDGAAIAVGITSGRANAGSLLLGEEGTEAVAGVLGSVTETVPLEPMSVTDLVNITVVCGDTVDRYAIRAGTSCSTTRTMCSGRCRRRPIPLSLPPMPPPLPLSCRRCPGDSPAQQKSLPLGRLFLCREEISQGREDLLVVLVHAVGDDLLARPRPGRQ